MSLEYVPTRFDFFTNRVGVGSQCVRMRFDFYWNFVDCFWWILFFSGLDD
jgi:hypothetical protein